MDGIGRIFCSIFERRHWGQYMLLDCEACLNIHYIGTGYKEGLVELGLELTLQYCETLSFRY